MFEPVSSQPNFATQEEEILSFWQENHIFEKSMELRKDQEPFVIYDGPPTANAKPPLHTMMPMAFKDLVGRYQTMKGRFIPRQAGWDTHGLPVEVQVEKALGLASKKDILNLVPGDPRASIELFNQKCRESVFNFKKEWDKFVPRVGYWTDTANPYITYDSSYIEGLWGVFKEIWQKEMVFKGYKVLPYCPRCGTGLSAAELAQEYQEVKDVSVFISFPLVDQPERSFLAWTTTPWTLPGNVGLAVGADIAYVVIKQEAGEYILAKSRLETVKGDYTIIEEMPGSDLVGLKYKAPFEINYTGEYQRLHEVVAANFVTTEDGTGIVHTAVMYGEDDFRLGQEVGFPMQHTVDLDGSFFAPVPEVGGKNIREALPDLLRYLNEKGVLYAKLQITHSYPFCWRCKTALIYYAKDSWYIAMSRMREQLVAQNQKVNWVPEHIRDGRFGDFVKEARDWAISRERFWGTPLPIWIAPSGKMLCIGSFAELKELAKNPENIGGNFDPHRPFIDDIVLVKDGEEYVREPHVLDVWFDSGSMPFASGREQKGLFPADYIAEAIDQTRGWFYTLQAVSAVIRGVSPYNQVTCMGHLVDEHGKKMSKSLGNIFDPWETFQICGVDAIRWFFYTVNAPGESKAFSAKELHTSFRKSILLVWNVLNYFVTYANVEGVSKPTPEDQQELQEKHTYKGQNLGSLDLWMLSKQAQLAKELTQYMDTYDFMRAGRLIEEYISDFSTWYLRRSRKRNDPAFFAVLYTLLYNLGLFMAPMTPFFSEKMYKVLTGDSLGSIHLQDWPISFGKVDEKILKSMNNLRQLVELGLSARMEAKLKIRQPLQKAFITSTELFDKEHLTILAEELNVLTVEQVKQFEEEVGVRRSPAGELLLDTYLTPELVQAGLAREFLRQLQNIRKNLNLQPGQMAQLKIARQNKAQIEPLFQAVPSLLVDAFLIFDTETGWDAHASQEVALDEQTIFVEIHS